MRKKSAKAELTEDLSIPKSGVFSINTILKHCNGWERGKEYIFMVFFFYFDFSFYGANGIKNKLKKVTFMYFYIIIYIFPL